MGVSLRRRLFSSFKSTTNKSRLEKMGNNNNFQEGKMEKNLSRVEFKEKSNLVNLTHSE